MEICIKWNICRVCLQEEQKDNKAVDCSSNEMLHLFNEDKKLALHIYKLSGIFMKPDDCLPDKICRKCVSVINNAVQFRKTCRSSNVYLKSILEKTKSASTFIKPELLIRHLSDNEIEDEEIGIEDSTVVKNEFENINLEIKKSKKAEFYDKTDHSHYFEKTEYQEKEDEQEPTDNLSSNTVELEEIIEISEEIEDQMFVQTIKGENDNFAKASNTAEQPNNNEYDADIKQNSEIDIPNLKADNGEGIFIIKRIKNTIENNEDLVGHEDNRSATDEDYEYVTIEEDEKMDGNINESAMLRLEEQNDNENQAQVSSTVDTYNEIEYYEYNSNASNLTSEVDEEFLVEENINNRDISSSNLYSEETTEKNSHALKILAKASKSHRRKRDNPVIFQRRKVQRNFLKSSAYSNSVCEICGNQFTNRNLMNIHMKVHFQEKNHECELCFKRFITSCNLQAHMRIHTGEKPFQCKYCGRRFNDRSSNIRHERTHTNEKPFKCMNCSKCFSLATTLQNHMKVHTNERSYRCEPCGKSFKLPHHLKTHQNTSLHRSVLQVGTNEN